MSEIEKYYNLVEDGRANGLSFHDSLDSMYWYRYIELVGKLVKLPFTPSNRCRRRV